MTTLEKTIFDYQDAYYNHQPKVSDDVYDTLFCQLQKEQPDSFVLKRVGASVDGDWPKVSHRIAMKSLDKANCVPDVMKWCPGNDFAIMDKLDGFSVAVCYRVGNFHQAISHGNGEVGDDLTRNVSIMEGVPKYLGNKDTPVKVEDVWIRGEVVCKRSVFNEYFKKLGYSNARNTASGIAQRHEGYEDCKYLTFMPYEISGPSINSKIGELTMLDDWGFITPNYKWIKTKDIEPIYNDYNNSIRDELDYDIDGLVIRVNNNDEFDSLGETSHHPKGAIAFKFPAESKRTILRSITWQIGNSGRFTPVGHFDIVNLAGANVAKAALHTVGRVEELKLYTGCEIVVSRRNDTIPYIEQNVSTDIRGTKDYLKIPTHCSACGSELEMNGEYLVCHAEDCPAQVFGSIKRWVNKLNILEFGDTVVGGTIEGGMVNDIADLYSLDPDKVVNAFYNGRRLGEGARKAVRNLNNKKELTLEDFVGSLGITLWGRSMIKTIIGEGFNTLDKLYYADRATLAGIFGVGEGRANSLVDGLKEKRELINKILSKGVTIKSNDGNLNGKTFCFTLFRDAALQESIERAGGFVKSSVSRKLNYLVTLDVNSDSTKIKTAKSNGTKVITPDEVKEMI